MADLPISYYKEEELTSDQVADLLKVNATAYDMYLLRNNLHTLRTQTDDSLKLLLNIPPFQ